MATHLGNYADEDGSEMVPTGNTSDSPNSCTIDHNGQAANHNAEHTGHNSSPDERCGCGCCHPQCLQALAHPKVYLLAISALVLIQGIQGGYLSSVVSTLEKRYDLRSSETGLVFSSYNWTCLIALIFVSYYGDHYNRARWLGYGCFLIAVALSLFTFPHFFGGTYVPDSNNSTISDSNQACNEREDSHYQQMNSPDDCTLNPPTTWALAIFIASQMIKGIGGSPIYTLGPTYLYDNVPVRHYSVYAGKHSSRFHHRHGFHIEVDPFFVVIQHCILSP